MLDSKYLFRILSQLILGLFKIPIESSEQPFVSVLYAALNINYFFNLLLLRIEVWVVLSQILRASYLLAACLGPMVWLGILCGHSHLPLAIANKFFFSVE